MNRRSTPEADAQRAIVQALRFALPRDAIVHHCVNEVILHRLPSFSVVKR